MAIIVIWIVYRLLHEELEGTSFYELHGTPFKARPSPFLLFGPAPCMQLLVQQIGVQPDEVQTSRRLQ